MAAGHGGQVLLSQATRELLPEELPGGIGLRDLGEHRLKDLTHAQRLDQLVLPGLESQFPALKTLENRPTNLPSQPTPLIGRERELGESGALLRRREVRLLTLTGPGGTGKTRLGLQLAAEVLDEFDDGVYFVNLAPLLEAALVVPTIAQTLALREQPGQTLEETLFEYLRGKELLLLLDNFEQVVEAASSVAQLLAAAPDVKVLVTSRAPLHVAGEHEYPVPPLDLPDPTQLPAPEALSQYEAVRLFIERAQAVKPDFEVTNENAPAVAEICVRLDGLPLAIELAAARIRVLPPPALLERLAQRLTLLTGGGRDVPARQQTLRGAIEWSYGLLDEAERTLFARLAVFVDGSTLAAAEAVLAPERELDVLEGLASLVEKSLVREHEGVRGEPRFSMLETIREYAGERLDEAGEAEQLRGRHAEYFVDFGDRAEPALRGPDGVEWLKRFDLEQANLHAVVAWALESDRPEISLRLAASLWRFWEGRATVTEVLRLVEDASSSARELPAELRARAFFGTARMAGRQGDWGRAHQHFEESLRLAREAEFPDCVALSLAGLGWVAMIRGESKQAVAFCEEALDVARSLGEPWIIADALNNLGCALDEAGERAKAKAAHEESLVLRRAIGELEGVTAALANLAAIATEERDYDRAETLLEDARLLAEARGDLWSIAMVRGSLGDLVLCQGDLPRARELAEGSLALSERLGYKQVLAYTLELLAGVAAAEGRCRRAARLLGGMHVAYDSAGAAATFTDTGVQSRLARAREELGESEWLKAFTEGRTMTLDEIITYAQEGKATTSG
jgi:predicted ATPase